KRGMSKRGNHKGLPLRAVRRGNPLWLPLAVKYLFICASVLIQPQKGAPFEKKGGLGELKLIS
ncbi:MAG: hypothetical protein DRQ99_03075, partial [Candidatus Parabeggiatoa sp. nov. 3]